MYCGMSALATLLIGRGIEQERKKHTECSKQQDHKANFSIVSPNEELWSENPLRKEQTKAGGFCSKECL